MKRLITLLAALALPFVAFSQEYKLVWSDEFEGLNPFTKPEAFPLRYEIDYVRIYSK